MPLSLFTVTYCCVIYNYGQLCTKKESNLAGNRANDEKSQTGPPLSNLIHDGMFTKNKVMVNGCASM